MTKPRKNAAQHGTQSKYQMGCRCDECRAAHAAATREYRRSRGMQPAGNPVHHDGTLYPTQRAAASALGVHETTIHRHLNDYGDLSLIVAQHHAPAECVRARKEGMA